MSNCNEILQCMRRGKTIGMLYRLFLATSLSNGCCPHRLFWTIRCISWMVHPPALPSCLQLWQSVLERSDAELGQVAASLLLFQPSCGLKRDLLTCSSKINTPDMFFWSKSFIICIMHVSSSSELCCFPAESWITESMSYPDDRVKSIMFKTCRYTSHQSKGSRITLTNTRKGHSLRQTEANL